MAISTLEGVVKGGQIRLRDNVQLPEDTEVFVIIPDFASVPRTRILSPRLVRPEQATDFVKDVGEANDDAGL